MPTTNQIFPKAIIMGGITDVVLSVVLGIPFTIYVISSRSMSGIPIEQRQSQVVSAIHSSVGLSIVSYAIGIFCSMLGGYVAATIAKRNELLNGVLACWLCIGIGIYSIASGRLQGPLWQHILSIVATPLCYLAGAYFWLRRNRPRSLSPVSPLEPPRGN